MDDLFGGLVEEEDSRRSLGGVWTRRVVLTVATALPVAALANLIGQQPADSRATVPAAAVTLSAPHTVRGGLLFQSRIEVRARRTFANARLMLDDGWIEGMQINSIEPQPTDEGSHQGRVVLSYGRLHAGDRLIVWVQSQVDPTQPGRRSRGLTLQDGIRARARIDRRITVLP